MTAGKAKVSVTLSRELLDRVDEVAAREPGATRSGVIERWLRLAARAEAAQALRDATVRYYESLSADEQEEDAALAKAARRRARRLRIDE